MTPPTIRRLIPAAIVAATAALAVAAGPASAKPIVHQTPKVPIVVDGKQMAPEQIHRFDGKPLYTRMSADGKTLIATTSLAKYKAVLKTKGVTLPRPGAKAPAKARSSGNGHWGRIWTDNFLRGNQLHDQLRPRRGQHGRDQRLQLVQRLLELRELGLVGRHLRARRGAVRPVELQPVLRHAVHRRRTSRPTCRSTASTTARSSVFTDW